MELRVGTSGYSYKEWQGKFYPVKFSSPKMLPYYAERFEAVESNYTFRRSLTAANVQKWAAETPDTFRFALKAPQKITHIRRLLNVDAEVDAFLAVANTLGHRRGPILYQLPPNFRCDVPRLEAFLKLIQGRGPAAFEFRHESWANEDVVALLRSQDCAQCFAEEQDGAVLPLVRTADWGYLRLRDLDYSDGQLRERLALIREQKWHTAWIFFLHEETGSGPRLAARLRELA